MVVHDGNVAGALEHGLGRVEAGRHGEVHDDEQIRRALVVRRVNKAIGAGKEPIQARQGRIVCQQVRDVLALPVLGDDLGKRQARPQRVSVGIGVCAHHDLGGFVYECRDLAELLALLGKDLLVSSVHSTYSASVDSSSSPASSLASETG